MLMPSRYWLLGCLVCCVAGRSEDDDIYEIPTSVLADKSVTFTYNYSSSVSSAETLWIYRNKPGTITYSYSDTTSECLPKGSLNDLKDYHVKCDSTSVTLIVIKVTSEEHRTECRASLISPAGMRSVLNIYKLYVIVPVQTVQLTYLNGNWTMWRTYVEGENVSMKCFTSIGRPQPNITWFIGDSYQNADNRISSQSYYAYFNSSEDAHVNTTSFLVFGANRSFNAKWIFCQSLNWPDVEPVHSNYTVLNIEYPPKIGNLTDTKVIEGHVLSKVCPIKDGNPSKTSVSWRDANNVTLSNTNELKLTNVSRSNATVYTCLVENNLTYSNGTTTRGINSGSFSLDVLYPPENITVRLKIGSAVYEGISDNFTLNENTILPTILTCSASGNPIPNNFSWTGSINNNSNTVTFNASRGVNGRYRCNVNNTMILSNGTTFTGSKKHEYGVDILYPPDVETLNDTYVMERDNIKINCSVVAGKTTNQTVTWWKNMTIVSSDSMLVISNVNRSNQGNYTCYLNYTMEPSYGETQTESKHTSFLLDVIYPPENVSVRLEMGFLHVDNIANIFSLTENTSLAIILKCSATGNPEPKQYVWYGPLNSTSAVLNINASRNFIGRYECQTNNSIVLTNRTLFNGLSKKVYHIEILYPPDVETLNDTYVMERDNVNINCSVIEGKTSNQTVTWQKNTKYVSNNTELAINNVSRSCQGNYTCFVNFTMQPSYGDIHTDSIQKSCLLHVLYPPGKVEVSLEVDSVKYNTIARSFSVIENSSTVLNCSADGNPTPRNITWLGHLFNTSSEILKLNTTHNSSGNYTCFAKNRMVLSNRTIIIGQINKSYEIDILYPPEFEDIEDRKVIEGQDYNINCLKTEGKTTNISANWLTNNNETKWNKSLNFSNVSRHDTGRYMCSLEYKMTPTYGHLIHENKNKSFYLDVLYPPGTVKVSLEVDFSKNFSIANTTFIIENTSAVLYCSADGNPTPNNYTWLANGVNITSKILKIKTDRNSSGNYTCFAKNIMEISNKTTFIGQTKQIYEINIMYPPEMENMTDTITVIETQNYSINCWKNAGITTYLSVKWHTSNNNTLRNNTLNISNLSRQHAGQYGCTLEYEMKPTYGNTKMETNTSSFLLDVLYPPENMSISLEVDSKKYEINARNFSVIENASLALNCSAQGRPTPSNFSLTSNEHNNNSAILKFKVTRNSRGKLKCVAQNKMALSNHTTIVGNTSREYQIDVKYPPELNEDRNISISEGSDVTMTCIQNNGTADNVTVRWIRSDDPRIHYSDILTLKNVTRSSSGIYFTCETTYTLVPTFGDHINKSINKTVYLEVTYSTYDGQGTPPGGGIAGPVAGGVIGSLLGIGAIVATVFIVRRRGLFSKAKNDDGGHHEYQNVGYSRELKQSKRLPALPPEEESEDVHGDHRTLAQQQQGFDTDEHPYLNTMELIDLMKKVNVSDLFSYVNNKSYQEFSDEFGRFPQGLIVSIPCSIASRPQNAPLNRYQGIYPYDHSRVIISGQPDFFINASYIDGHSGEQEYIASLGPTVKHTLGFRTFWNMVWHQRSDVIVMLTNLQEPSGMKCEKYWADRGTTRNIGDFTIQSVNEEVAADYKVRTFKVFKDDESRMVTQLHFTAWPDKKVPEDVTSLIEFRQRVKAAPTRSLGPLIVHCSAGVGRTGTYIALDRLIEEGKGKNAINVYDCVMNMRKQRVNMVQTLDQYVYLHQALVYCLVFDIEPISSKGIEEYVKKTSNNVYSKLFQQLQQSVEDESIEEKEARARNGDILDKNLKQADIPGDAHRIRLFLDKQMGQSDYINAVYLNGFERQEHFIIAQSPLPTTLDDFVCLLYQATCCCIVSLDDYQQTGASNVTYLPPDNQPMKYGTFTISCSNLDVKSGYSVRKMKISHTGQFEKGERIVYHFEFTGWKQDERTPKDPKLFVEFVKEVDKYATELEDEHSHVLVHCMTGSERSGLFCAVYNLMDKMEQERQVSVVNMLRRVRARRKTAIPNMEQLKFCYQALNAFVKNYKI